ncbi:hypothetical protein E2C01_062549 [Portunus trituberculatus]|uniref:Uncharacterized protein n=1 Tax=Portunus trituberculatus TaxID=210409 RepID=A0A5B7HEZ8_PORTR|nr:hypothetical protein [Portunus trituberculatus]
MFKTAAGFDIAMTSSQQKRSENAVFVWAEWLGQCSALGRTWSERETGASNLKDALFRPRVFCLPPMFV